MYQNLKLKMYLTHWSTLCSKGLKRFTNLEKVIAALKQKLLSLEFLKIVKMKF